VPFYRWHSGGSAACGLDGGGEGIFILIKAGSTHHGVIGLFSDDIHYIINSDPTQQTLMLINNGG
jgi:hypothetical protein